MRTTLNIDDDVLNAVRELADRAHSSAGAVLSDLARQTLHRVPTAPQDSARAKNGWPVIPSRGGIVTSKLVYEILDEDE